MKTLQLDNNSMEELKMVIADTVREFCESKYENIQYEQSIDIDWRFELEGYSRLKGKNADEHYHMWGLEMKIMKKQLAMKNMLSAELFMEKMIGELDPEGVGSVGATEDEQYIHLDIEQYCNESVLEFKDVAMVMTNMQKKLEQALINTGVMNANVEVRFLINSVE